LCKFVANYLVLRKGLVIKSTGSWYNVLENNSSLVKCVIKGKFRVKGFRTTNPIAVGDTVFFETEDDDIGVIREIGERKNYIIRRSSNLSKQSQIIAANLDQALLMVTLREPVTPEEFIDRFLMTAESFRIPVIIIFNKTDIYTADDMDKLNFLISAYTKIGYRCEATSLQNGAGAELILDLSRERVSLIAGNSGVGKSTLLNSLLPGQGAKTAEISDYHKKGKHTTTFAEMFQLPCGGFVIDTPGLRGFGITDLIKEEIYHFFPEIFKVSAKCRFNNCLHEGEPDCAVYAAVESGEIEAFRYRSYLNIIWDENSKYR
jgi:ribosome biogenesis GTPase